MFDRFTDEALRVIVFSRDEAERLGHNRIGPEHVLLGLMSQWTDVAAGVFEKLDIDVRRIRTEVQKLVNRGTRAATEDHMPLTPQARSVIECASEEATTLGHRHIGTEHLLLGLLHQEDGVAALVLRDVALTRTGVRERLAEIGDSQWPMDVRGWFG